MYDHILIRYGELTTKGANRSDMEQILERNVRQAFVAWPQVRVGRIHTRIVVELHGVPERHCKHCSTSLAFPPFRLWRLHRST
ncbi:hypothetical protein GCM10025858_32680 [Alicyclobacillus sacchari]|uniref:hypothetical protein n=1 Tax=Alicyclobacillus sacchari TaxID=392010 RepID=UPI0023EA13D8|nr:hypothetical protein [Alicyclobacillus sacchari]GMA58765.1 hypothetical protein GCM10025858_32680 [Alicyclobacillus sacchari]